MKTKIVALLIIVGSMAFYYTSATEAVKDWVVLNTVPYPGKQDDIFFINRNVGWYANGMGFIYHTSDGGENWIQKTQMPGTFFRALGFANETIGFAGNIGPDYFPGVTDSQPVYMTTDAGSSWLPLTDLSPQDIKGICAIDILKTKFIESGILKDRTTIFAAGRVGGPAKLVISKDLGKTWSKYDLSSYVGMIQDVKYINESTGFICAGSDPNVEKSHAQILKTTDGGVSWRKVYESKRSFELVWKCSFPSDKVGYATVLNYDQSSSQKVIAKTTDGGESWHELPLVKDPSVKEFGIGFVDENRGWVGTANGIWETFNGGMSWSHKEIGHAINKIRVVKDKEGAVVYGIGSEVIKLQL